MTDYFGSSHLATYTFSIFLKYNYNWTLHDKLHERYNSNPNTEHICELYCLKPCKSLK